MIGHPPSLRFERAHRLLQWAEPERTALRDLLMDFGQRVYLQTILAEMDRHDIDLSPARVRDTTKAWADQATARVRDIADRDATRIMQTRNQLITNAVDRALGRDSFGIDTNVLIEELRKIDDAYATWKAEQINETERYIFYQAGFEDFYQQNTDLATLFDFGGSLQCELCQAVADAGPYTREAMVDVDDPVHVGCLDTFSPVG